MMEEAHDDNPLAIVLYKPPHIQTDNIFVGAARVVYGPPLPPVMSWARTFDALMGAATAMHVPRQLQMPILDPIMIPKRSWAMAFDTDALEPPPSDPAVGKGWLALLSRGLCRLVGAQIWYVVGRLLKVVRLS